MTSIMTSNSVRNQVLRPGFRLPPKGVVHCHRQIKDTAEGLAHALFDELMSRNEIWSQFKSQHPGKSTKDLEALFVKRMWPRLIESARATLAAMLNGPYSEEMKEEIAHVLVQDASLMRGRKAPAQVIGALK